MSTLGISDRHGKRANGESNAAPPPADSAAHSTASRPTGPVAFVQYLVRNDIISEEIGKQALRRRNEGGSRDKHAIANILVDEFGVSRDILNYAMAKFYSFRIIHLHDRSARTLQPPVVNKLMNGLPSSLNRLAFKHKVLPFEPAKDQPDKLLVVTPHPTEREPYEIARAFPYKRFEICYMSDRDWTEYWRQITLDKQQTDPESIAGDMLFEEEDADLDIVLDTEISRSQVIQLVENVFSDAVRVGASDIHVVPRAPRKTDILFRIDGLLSLWRSIEDIRAEAVVAVVKGKSSHLDRFERMAAQDGSAQKLVDDQIVRFRLSVLPIISRHETGKLESIVIRILKEASTTVTLENIGFDGYSLRVFKDAIAKPHGIVILTGPTGSGKSTTLVATLRAVMKPSLNTLTVEDPVEYLIDDARQIKLNYKLDFEGAMRAILRHDPDIVMLGEIRDRTTADIAIKLANTGHLTFSTLHTNDAPSAVSRLFKMGVEPFLIAQALNIVVAQRLVRKLCEHCKAPADDVSRQTLLHVGFTQEEAETVKIFKSVGCPQCVEGFKGRMAIHESLYVSAEIRDIILESGERIDLQAIRESARKHGMQTLRRSGIDLVKKGISTIEEVVSSTTMD